MSLIFGRTIRPSLFRIPPPSAILLLVLAPAAITHAAQRTAFPAHSLTTTSTPPASAAAESAGASAEPIPPGTILPIRLPSISSAKLKAGDTIKAKLAQDVPLPGDGKIHEGAAILGTVLSTTTSTPGLPATLTIKFDTLVQHGRSTPIHTDLRALASTMEVLEAQTPTTAPGESDVYDWLSTRQVGGDTVYGRGGPVVAADSVKVGESVYAGGVLVELRANPQGGCRGAVAGNERPQALWVFSAAACGLYGFEHLQIRHAGRTAPVGTIILESTKGPVRTRGGSAALLRVSLDENQAGAMESSGAGQGALRPPIRSGKAVETAVR